MLIRISCQQKRFRSGGHDDAWVIKFQTATEATRRCIEVDLLLFAVPPLKQATKLYRQRNKIEEGRVRRHWNTSEEWLWGRLQSAVLTIASGFRLPVLAAGSPACRRDAIRWVLPTTGWSFDGRAPLRAAPAPTQTSLTIWARGPKRRVVSIAALLSGKN